MPNWKKVIVSGSSPHFNHITASGNVSGSATSTASFGHYIGIPSSNPFPFAGDGIISGSLLISSSNVGGVSTASLSLQGSGSTIFTIQGSQGNLFSVTDDLLHDNLVVNDISGDTLFKVSGSGLVTIPVGDLSGSGAATASYGTYIGDGSQLTGIPGTNLTQSIFVTQNGNDTTAVVGNMSKPFATLESASQAATTGSTIFVYPGMYTVEASYNLALAGVDYYFYPNTTVSKSTAGDMFTMPAGTQGCNVYGQADFILGSSAGSLVQGNYTNNNYNYEFECRDIFSDSSTAIVDTFTADDHVSNWKFRVMSSSAGGGFSQSNIYTDGVLNIDCQEIITSGICIGTGNGYRGGIIKAKLIKSTGDYTSTFYAGGIGLTLLVDKSEGVGGTNSNAAFRFTNAGEHNLVGDTSGIQFGITGGTDGFSGTLNHFGSCDHLSIVASTGRYYGGTVTKVNSYSTSNTGTYEFIWETSGTATNNFLNVAGGNLLVTCVGNGGYAEGITVTGGKLILDGYVKDQHAQYAWSVSGGEFIFKGIAEKYQDNGVGYGQNQVLSLSGGVCKIQGTIDMSPVLGDSNQTMINYTGGKLILDGATLTTTGSYPVLTTDESRAVHIFSGGVSTNQTGSNGLLVSGDYVNKNPLGGMIIEDASVE